jgi:hypothetical protein
MADQIALRAPRNRWKEGSAFTVAANFRTRSSASASTPTNVYYRVDCVTTGTELTDWTSISAASSASISITATHNAIQDDANDMETKQLTVVVDKDLSTQHREVYRWIVENLYGSP